MARHKTNKTPLPPDAQVGEQVDERSDAAAAGGASAPARAKAGAAQKTDAAKAKDAVAPNDYSDLIFGGSFIGAALLGVFNGINTLRHGFYQNYIKPKDGVISGAKEAVWDHPFAEIFQNREATRLRVARDFNAGKIDGEAYNSQILKAYKDANAQIDERLTSKLGIKYNGWRGWTTSLWKMKQHTGIDVRRNALLTMAQTSVVTLGAIATLKYTKHLLDRIDDNEKQLNDAKQHALLADKPSQAIPATVVSEVAQSEKLQPTVEHAASL